MKNLINLKSSLSQFLELLCKQKAYGPNIEVLKQLKVGTRYEENIQYFLQNFKMTKILTESSGDIKSAAHEISVKLELVDKYTKLFDNQCIYFSSNLPKKSMGDFNVFLENNNKILEIRHEIKYREGDSAYSAQKMLNTVKKYGIDKYRIDHKGLESSSEVRRLCYDISSLKDKEIEQLYTNINLDKFLLQLSEEEGLLIYDTPMEFDEMVDLLVGFELNPNVQPLLDYPLSLTV